MPQSRQLAAIMFTNIVGYTGIDGEDEPRPFDLLNKKPATAKNASLNNMEANGSKN